MILTVDEFTIYRHDRSDTRGGGVCIIAKNMASITSHQISVPSKFSSIEIVCVDLCINSSCGVRFIALYIPPRATKDDTMCSLIIAALEHLSNTTSLPVCIMGDLNLPLIDWSSNSTSDIMHTKFLTFFLSNSFIQFVNFPTRDSNILDVILVDDPSIICNVRPAAPIGCIDPMIR